MGNGLSTDQGSFTPHGLRDVDGTGAEQRQHDWSNPEDGNMLAGAPNYEELNSLSKFNTRHTPNVQSKTCDLHIMNAVLIIAFIIKKEIDITTKITYEKLTRIDNKQHRKYQ